jgi:hypothetical protein
MHLSLYLACVSGERVRRVKGGSPKNRGSSLDRRTCWQREKRRDLRHDVIERRLREDLIGNFPKLSEHILF